MPFPLQFLRWFIVFPIKDIGGQSQFNSLSAQLRENALTPLVLGQNSLESNSLHFVLLVLANLSIVVFPKFDVCSMSGEVLCC